MSVVSVIGGQWGDEGKGKIVDYICRDIDLVARYQGGANAGHTVYINNKKIVLHQIPSGIIRENCDCILGNGMVVDPIGLVEEIKLLESFNINVEDRMYISFNSHIVTPFHKMIDKFSESKSKSKIGTTLKGIGPAYVDKYNRAGILAFDLLDHSNLNLKLQSKLSDLTSQYDNYDIDLNEVNDSLDKFKKCCQKISKYIKDGFNLLHERHKKNSNILIEGAQGTMLDIDHGTYPYVTSSSPTSGGISTGLGFPGNQVDENIGIFKAYTTRVGEGPFPTELNDRFGEKLRRIGSEFGATTGRPRRCGWFDAVAARYSCKLNGFTKIALTKLDILDEFDEVLICNSYKVKGKEYSNFSEVQYYLNEVEPVFQHFPGWNESTYGKKSFEELPENAKKYILLLSNVLETPIKIISTGPKRNQIISI